MEQTFKFNETHLPAYTLPDILTCENTPVTAADIWFDKRYPEVLKLLSKTVFGVPAGLPANVGDELVESVYLTRAQQHWQVIQYHSHHLRGEGSRDRGEGAPLNGRAFSSLNSAACWMLCHNSQSPRA